MDSVEDTAEAVGCPIRESTDQCLLAAPHGLSQRAASFIASQCQGIHQMPFRRLISTTNAPRAGESPQGPLTSPQPHPAKMHHMTQPTATPTLEAAALSGHPRSQSSSHVKDPIPASADICVLSRGYLTAGSSKVTIRHCPFPLVEADGIEPTTSCLQSTRSPN